MQLKEQKSIAYIFFALLVSLTLYFGCAPLPPAEEELVEEEEAMLPELTEAERDSIMNVHRSFAHEYWKQGNYEKALAYFDTIRTLDYEHEHKIYRALADCYINTGQIEEAIEAYEEGVKYFPEDDYLHASLSHMYRNQGWYEEAIEQLKAAIEIKPDEIEYKKTLAELYEKADDWDGAIRTYEELTQLLPEDTGLKDKLDNIIRQHRNPEEYLSALKEGIEQFPDDMERRYKYAQTLIDQGYNRKAAEEFRFYAKQMPDDTKGWKGLANSLDNLGETRGAIKAYKKLVDLEPDNLEAMTAIGKDYLLLNEWQQARNWGYRALAKDSQYGPAWILLGDLYQKAADDASGDQLKYDDKLVYTIAYGFYKRAATSSDPQARSDAKRSMAMLKNSEAVPSKSDKFMHLKDTRPTDEAYNWIDENWNETKYIDEYLEELG